MKKVACPLFLSFAAEASPKGTYYRIELPGMRKTGNVWDIEYHGKYPNWSELGE